MPSAPSTILGVRRVLRVLGPALALLIGSAPVTGAAAEDLARSQRPYAQPNRLVDIGGRRRNLYCLGTGSPTVVFESGGGVAGWDWLRVHAAVAKTTRACIYDRAGLGFSDPSGRPGTSANAVDDLSRLLTAAQLPPPYVLVGHSYGGMNVRLFASRYTQQVAGLVLVDGHHEDEFARLDAITAGKYAAMTASFKANVERCLAGAKSRFERDPAARAECIGTPEPFYGRAMRRVIAAQFMAPAYWQAVLSEDDNLHSVSADQVRAERRPFGALPLACLIRGVSPYRIAGKPQSDVNKAVERENEAMMREIAGLSSVGRCRIVPGAGHAIETEKPEAVIDAVRTVLAQQKR